MYERRWFGRNRHHSLTMFIGVVLNENVKQTKILWIIIEICLNPKSLQAQRKSCLFLRNLAQTFPHGPMIWKVMQRNALNDIANWRTEHPSNCTKLQLHALMTINLRKKKWDLLENCQKFAHKLYWNACTLHESEDQTFCGRGEQTCKSSHKMDSGM